jgi:predicted small secreted protein
MMKIRHLAVALLLVGALLAAVLTSTSCGRDSQFGGVALDLLQRVPEEALSYSYWDIRQMEDDQNLAQILDAWGDANEADLQNFAIDATKIKHAVQFSMPEGPAIIIKGDQNRNDLRTDLEALHFDEQDFRQEEIWKNEEDTQWLSILGDLIVAGERNVVMDCIRVAKGEPSLYDDSIVRILAEELRTGVTVYIKTHTIEETPYDGLEATGISVWKMNSSELSARMVFTFRTTGDAAAILQTLADDVDEFYDKVKAERDGRVATIEARIEIDDFEIWPA